MGDSTLHLPRLLCFHGAGSTAQIFQLQCRSLSAELKQYFRLCFVDGPFLCEPGPGITTVYNDFGPFRRWLKWRPDNPTGPSRFASQTQIPDEESFAAIWEKVADVMRKDDALGATGKWVGMLGFSQGAKVAASLLYRQQRLGEKDAGTSFRFALLMNGPGPIVVFGEPGSDQGEEKKPPVLELPTIHVHALQDTALERHRILLRQFCRADKAQLIEWDGDHRVPLKMADVMPIVNQVLDLADETGAV